MPKKKNTFAILFILLSYSSRLLLSLNTDWTAATWPRPFSLIAFWPLNSQNGLTDVYNLYSFVDGFATLCFDLPGPFGDPCSCFKASERNHYIGTVRNFPLPTETFTLSFYYRVKPLSDGNLISMSSLLAVNYRTSNRLQFVVKDRVLGFVEIANSDGWNFITITYNLWSSALSVYDEEAQLLKKFNINTAPAPIGQSTEISVGTYSSNAFMLPGFEILWMNEGDAVACLTIYDEVLGSSEIAQLPDVCRDHSTVNINACEEQLYWPNRASLAAFWPFDASSGLSDIANFVQPKAFDHSFKLETESQGPFGMPCTSFSASCESIPNCNLPVFRALALEDEAQSFTVSFFVYSNFTATGGLLWAYRTGGTGFSISYSNPNVVDIWSQPQTEVTLIATAPILVPGQWNFVVLTFDRPASQLTLKGGTSGNLTDAIFTVNTNLAITLGGAILVFGKSFYGRDQDMIRLQQGDRIACFMIHEDVLLLDDEIQSVIESCKARSTNQELNSTCIEQKTWPRRSELVSFHPLHQRSGLNDVANFHHLWPQTTCPKPRLNGNGPFNQIGTSYTVATDGCIIGRQYFSWLPKANQKSFTISFYIYTKAEDEGGIIAFQGSAAGKFSISYSSPNLLRIVHKNSTLITTGLLKNEWSFFTIIFDETSNMLSISNSSAILAVAADVDFIGGEYSNFFLGGAYLDGPTDESSTNFDIAMKTSDALACLMVYETALSREEIRQLPAICESQQHSEDSATATEKMEPGSPNAANPNKLAYLIGILVSGFAVLIVPVVIFAFWRRSKRTVQDDSIKELDVAELPVIISPHFQSIGIGPNQDETVHTRGSHETALAQ